MDTHEVPFLHRKRPQRIQRTQSNQRGSRSAAGLTTTYESASPAWHTLTIEEWKAACPVSWAAQSGRPLPRHREIQQLVQPPVVRGERWSHTVPVNHLMCIALAWRPASCRLAVGDSMHHLRTAKCFFEMNSSLAWIAPLLPRHERLS